MGVFVTLAQFLPVRGNNRPHGVKAPKRIKRSKFMGQVFVPQNYYDMTLNLFCDKPHIQVGQDRGQK